MGRFVARVDNYSLVRRRNRQQPCLLGVWPHAPGCGVAFAPLLDVRERIVIEIDGIDDPSLVDAIEETVRASFRERVLPGSWRILIRPSRVNGRWDVHVFGLDVRHALSIAVPAPLLPDLIPLRLRESLERLCTGRIRAVGPQEGMSKPAALSA